MSRADLGAYAAADAFLGIDHRQCVLDDDGNRRALALTLHAADAAGRADLHHDAALVVAGAGGVDAQTLGDELNDVLGTDVHARTAADALGAVHVRNAVDYMHGVKLAGTFAVAETDAGEGAELVALAAEEHGGAAEIGRAHV